jgi:hypothetical protein
MMNFLASDMAEKVISRLMVGAQLDSIRVYSVIMQMGFFVPVPVDGFPNEVWLTFSGVGTFHDVESVVDVCGAHKSQDFFEVRASFLKDAYFLLGKQIDFVSIKKSGALELKIGEKYLMVESEEDSNLEDIWSVRNGAYEPMAEEDWYITLGDSGVLAARIPSKFLNE